MLKQHVVEIACGERHILALDKNERVFSWGENESGQLG